MSTVGKTAAVYGCLFLLMIGSASGAEFLEHVTENRLPNGLKVILLENHKSPTVTFQVWYRAGSRNDPWGKTGLAHVFEHLMFKGTPNVSKEDFTRRIEAIGGNFNAFTSHDYAAYFENAAVDHLEVPIFLEADRMANLVFTEAEFQTEKMVVMEERRLRTQDQPKAFLMEQVAAVAFQAQPYHWPVIGWMGDLNRIDFHDGLAFYKKYYDPANAFIVAVGDFQKDRILAAISKRFGGLPMSEVPENYRYQDPPQMGPRQVIVSREAALPFAVIGYHVPNLSEPDGYVLEVLSAILSGGRSARIYENLVRGKRVAISAGASYSFLSADPPLFYLYAEPLPGKGAEEVKKALTEEINKLQETRVSDRELEKAKNQLEAAFIFGQDSFFFQGMLLARYEIASSWKDIRKYIPMIRAVSVDDIRRVARTYFQTRNRTVGLLIPEKYEEGGENAPNRKPAERSGGKQ
ncbi:MAG: pitrilysin family protein [Desulfobacterales bacterium]